MSAPRPVGKLAARRKPSHPPARAEAPVAAAPVWRARLYDLFYAEKNYAAEARFVHGLIAEHSQPPGGKRLLELACGTGRHAFELERLGYRVTATDLSEEMVAAARAKGATRGSGVEFRRGDMRDPPPRAGAFDAVVCLFDSIGYLERNEDLDAALAGVSRALRPGGVFVCEFWHAAAMLRHFDPVRLRRFARPEGGEVARLSETRLDVARQVAEVVYTVWEIDAAGRCARFTDTHACRYFLVREFAAFLAHHGLTPTRWCAGFSRRAPITDLAFHVVVAARRAGKGSA